jgi:hypothetical protein
MQEVFEIMIRDALDAAAKDRDEMLMNIDGMALLKHMKLERALAENHRMGAERQLKEFLIRKSDASEEHVEDELVRDACDFARIVETMDWAIDLIESGRYSKELKHEF